MIVFDTDILTDIFFGNEVYVARASATRIAEQFVPIVVVEEILRGRLDLVRRAEAGKTKLSLITAYALFSQTVQAFFLRGILLFTEDAETQFDTWRSQKLKVKTHDLRIAAIAVVHDATLITRNRRDYEQVPGLKFEFWE